MTIVKCPIRPDLAAALSSVSSKGSGGRAYLLNQEVCFRTYEIKDENQIQEAMDEMAKYAADEFGVKPGGVMMIGWTWSSNWIGTTWLRKDII